MEIIKAFEESKLSDSICEDEILNSQINANL